MHLHNFKAVTQKFAVDEWNNAVAPAPKEPNDYQRMLASFVKDMQYRLYNNRSKGDDWCDMSYQKLTDLLQDNAQTLHNLITDGYVWERSNNDLLYAFQHACADVANYAFMLSDKANKENNR